MLFEHGGGGQLEAKLIVDGSVTMRMLNSGLRRSQYQSAVAVSTGTSGVRRQILYKRHHLVLRVFCLGDEDRQIISAHCLPVADGLRELLQRLLQSLLGHQVAAVLEHLQTCSVYPKQPCSQVHPGSLAATGQQLGRPPPLLGRQPRQGWLEQLSTQLTCLRLRACAVLAVSSCNPASENFGAQVTRTVRSLLRNVHAPAALPVRVKICPNHVATYQTLVRLQFMSATAQTLQYCTSSV